MTESISGNKEKANVRSSNTLKFVASDFEYKWSCKYLCLPAMAYPTVDGMIDTIAWEGFREGVDDVRYGCFRHKVL